MGKVEPQPVRLHQGARLVAVVPQDLHQGTLEQMGGGMGPADGCSAGSVNGCNRLIVHLDLPGQELAVVQILAALVLLHIGDNKFRLPHGDAAVVGRLAAHLRIEWRPVQNQNASLAAGNDPGDLAVHANRQHLGSISVFS